MKRIVAALASLVVTGCALGPDYERPQVVEPKTLATIAGVGSGIRLSADKPLDRWWECFHDERLNQLVGEARAQNLSLRAALARVQVARSMKRAAFSPLLPHLGSGGQYSYNKQAINAITVLPDGIDIPDEPYQLWSGALDLAYEVDLWGRVRRGHEAASAGVAATVQDKRAMETSVAAEVAETYFDLGEAEALVAIARENVELRERSLKVIQGKVKIGLAMPLELRRAEGELASTRALVPEFERRHAFAEHRLAVLLGHPPDVKFSGKVPAAFELPPEVPVGLPATLLERRPDVKAAEERLRAANARIGEAVANFFPKITILGRFGYASVNAWTLANPHAQLWSIGPSVDLPIFSGGLTYARMLEAEARRDEATAVYLETILQAFREVADAVSSIDAHQRIRDCQRDAVKASEQSVTLATSQYERGLATYLSVLDAQSSLLTARRALVSSERLLLSDLVQLQRALGGGWTEETSEESPPAQ